MNRELLSVNETIKDCNEEIKDLTVMMSKTQGNSESHQLKEKEIEALEKAEDDFRIKREKVESELKKLEEEQKRNENKEVQELR